MATKPEQGSVKISFSPIKEIIVHEYVSVEYDDLLRGRVTPSGSFPLFWCGGFLYTFNSLPWTRDVIKEYLDGRAHWSEVHYTKMEKYKPVLDLNDDNYKAQIKIRVIDTSKSLLHLEFVKWLKGMGV